MEQQPAGDRRGRMQRNVDIVESRRNGPQPSMRHDDDDGDYVGRIHVGRTGRTCLLAVRVRLVLRPQSRLWRNKTIRDCLVRGSNTSK